MKFYNSGYVDLYVNSSPFLLAYSRLTWELGHTSSCTGRLLPTQLQERQFHRCISNYHRDLEVHGEVVCI